ncbi:hypothetical protein OJAV_G00116710 [Oryzias javanicus]|uniref:Spindlin n=1 Tax=Oryzias javanicus TaxID=123683 RepID=A0A3S2M0M7_ORYJA|nr:hypothetical protein OJAV_G00116710 [Oryzias javanicus]
MRQSVFVSFPSVAVFGRRRQGRGAHKRAVWTDSRRREPPSLSASTSIPFPVFKLKTALSGFGPDRLLGPTNPRRRLNTPVHRKPAEDRPGLQSTPGHRDSADTGHAGVSANMMKKKNPHKKHKSSLGPATKVLSQPRRDIVGCRIQHIWKEGAGHVVWKGTVLDQVPVNPSLYLIKYDGFDCVYGLELHKDERVQGLEVLPDRLAKSRLTDVNLADAMIGKAVEHMFETEEGPKEEWRGMVLARAPIMTTWFYITYEKDPVLYMYQLLDDYKEGDLRIMPDSNDSVSAEREPGEVVDSLVGKQVEYAKEDGGKRTGMVIHQVEAKPSVYFIKFDDDFLIYVYDLVKTS